MRCVLFIFSSLFLVEVLALDQERYLNVVLFFTNYNEDHVGRIAYLNISKVAVVKPCLSEEVKQQPQNNYRRILHGTYRKRCNCLQGLNNSVNSLVDWARGYLHMAVAMVTLKNSNDNNVITYYVDNNDNQKQDHSNADFIQLPLPPPSENSTEDYDLPKLEVQKTEDEDDDSILMINAYPREMRFNAFSKNHPQHYVNLKRVKKTIGVPPINYKVIHINSNRNSNVSTTNPKPTNTLWDLLGSMAQIKDTIVSNIVNTFWDDDLPDYEQLDTSSLGKIQKRSFFHITQDVLSNIIRVQDKKGFFLVVYGGELTMLKDPYSELVQSLKHVMETSDNTLIVVTSSCPTFFTDDTKIPIYATGPSARKFTNATTLMDVPKILRAILFERNVRTRNSDISGSVKKAVHDHVHDDASKYFSTGSLILPFILYLLN